jgi:hypothetical protein
MPEGDVDFIRKGKFHRIRELQRNAKIGTVGRVEMDSGMIRRKKSTFQWMSGFIKLGQLLC